MIASVGGFVPCFSPHSATGAAAAAGAAAGAATAAMLRFQPSQLLHHRHTVMGRRCQDQPGRSIITAATTCANRRAIVTNWRRRSRYYPTKPCGLSVTASMANEATTTPTTTTRPVAVVTPAVMKVRVHNGLDLGCVDYARGWMWQQYLVQQQLYRKRTPSPAHGSLSSSSLSLQTKNRDDNDSDDTGSQRWRGGHEDSILVLEHYPVYTLGRGAREDHMVCLSNHHNHNHPAAAAAATTEHDVAPIRLLLQHDRPNGSHGENGDNPTGVINTDGQGTTSTTTIMNRKSLLNSARFYADSSLMRQMQDWIEQNRNVRHQPPADNDDDDDYASIPVEVLDQLFAAANSSMSQAAGVQPVYAPNGVPIYRVERGGEVTFHGPGQLVMYPILDLERPYSPFRKDLHWYLRQLEQVVINTLEHHYNIPAGRDDINTGVWVGHNKIAAVGVACSRWVTSHGIALNVNPNLDYFDTSIILPCGIEGRGVTSVAQILQQQHNNDGTASSTAPIPSIHEVAQALLVQVQDVFGIDLETDISSFGTRSKANK